ncbi:MAG: hypothetical protein FRX48_09313 [Lasallia pustulata]|uniref:SET domain-containing protein n=1 Tax=Lasallia pustulata TaxID=136370 RepID=A0A5M8PC49_9LECA|nr:MAG: hypothetical protein FRX48_09313 [Lasallia pustulata]
MQRKLLPIETLPAWAELNNVEFDGVKVSSLPAGKGSGVVATAAHSEDGAILMRVPQELVLSLGNVWMYAKSDQHLREVLEATGEYARTARGAILIFLLLQVTSTSLLPVKIGASNPFTGYVQFLPSHIPLPTFWENAEIEMVKGTSLEGALRSKLNSLNREFDHLRDSTRSIKWCQQYWWDQQTGLLSLDDWKQVDAMYRSRALDLPGTGHAVVPCIDMANHASGKGTVARYDTDADGGGVLVLRDGKSVVVGDEVTITYGDDKGACEMLFSYGFIEESMDSAQELFLDLDIPDDDPLKQVKKTVAKSPPGVRLFRTGKSTGWEGPFAWLLCVNEEDGLKFGMLQTTDGGRELNVSWKGQDLVDGLELEVLLKADPLWDVYNLRAITTVQGRVESQLHSLVSAGEQMQVAGEQGPLSPRYLEVAMRLHDLEEELLLQAYEDFEHQKLSLLESAVVQEYLRSAAKGGVEDDFS